MLNNFGNFLDNLIRFINLDVPKSTVEAIIKEASFSVKKEDPASHKRQVLPGDHVRKLKRETVAFLNLEFRQILKELNYKELVKLQGAFFIVCGHFMSTMFEMMNYEWQYFI